MFLSQIMALVSGVPVLWFVKLSENAFPLIKETPRAVGYQLRSAYEVEIPAQGIKSLKTDVAVQLPQGCFGKIVSRSGLPLHPFIDALEVVMKETYRGQLLCDADQ
jgi:dUTP pyrophosphatase